MAEPLDFGTFASRRTGRMIPRSGVPACPRWLTGAARAEWNRVAKPLAAVGRLTMLDQTMLGVYCSDVAQLQQARAGLSRSTDEQERGVWADVAADSEQQVRDSCAAFMQPFDEATGRMVIPAHEELEVFNE
jgi:phage terminase small subunit